VRGGQRGTSGYPVSVIPRGRHRRAPWPLASAPRGPASAAPVA